MFLGLFGHLKHSAHPPDATKNSSIKALASMYTASTGNTCKDAATLFSMIAIIAIIINI